MVENVLTHLEVTLSISTRTRENDVPGYVLLG